MLFFTIAFVHCKVDEDGVSRKLPHTNDRNFVCVYAHLRTVSGYTTLCYFIHVKSVYLPTQIV
jgi:hypothetical protein